MRIAVLLSALIMPFHLARAADPPWLAELVARLDPAAGAAAALAALPATADEAVQIRVIAGVLRGREVPGGLWVIPEPAATDPIVDLQKAEDALTHLIHSQYGSEQFGDTLPWFSPGKRVQTLARFPHFRWLAPAYAATGDERYARAMVRDMMDFVDHAPIERAAWVSPQTDPVVNPWNWVLQLWRITRWIDALTYLRHSPSLSDSAYCRIALHLWKEVEWLVPRMQLGLHNSTLGNIRAVLYAGIRFPDARASALWRSTATGMFRFFLDTYFYPGEVSIELTLGYSSAVLGQCLTIYEDLPDSTARQALRPVLEALVEGHLGLMKPDRSLPRYGDHGDYDFTRSVLARAARLFGREDWQAMLAEKDSGWYSYPPRSMPYYLSGYYAMRDGWGPRAQYLSMDAGPFGTNHQHGDKLSITLSADGAEFIVDPGTSIYRTTREVTLYDLRPGFLHNTITVDGADPAAGYDQHYQFDVLENRWITAPFYDFLDGVYDYRACGREAMARRSVLYIRGEYWLMLDAVYGGGRALLENNLQFAPGVIVQAEGGTALARAPAGAALAVEWVAEGLTASVVRGERTFPGSCFPFRYGKNLEWERGGRGWVGAFGNHSADMHAVEPAPALLLTGAVELPHFALRLFAPSRGTLRQALVLDAPRLSADGIVARVVLSDSGRQDHFRWQPGRLPTIAERPAAEGGCWVRERGGRVEQIIVLNSREAEVQDGELAVRLRFSDRAEVVARRTAAGWSLSVDPASPAGLRLEEFEVQDRGSAPQRCVTDDGSDGLVPGTRRFLVPYP